jgi:hypothetical protein
MSSRLEERLRDGLDALADTVQPATPNDAWLGVEARAQRSQRRRARRPALVAFAVVTLVIGAVAGSAWWITRKDAEDQRPAKQPTPSTVPACREGGALPCDPGDQNLQLTQKVVVAEGEHNGLGWKLLAFYSKAGLCLHFRVNPDEGGGCGFGVPPGTISVGGGRQAGLGAVSHGVVRKDVALVRLELSNGDTIEATPVGAEAGFEANFFVAILPEDVDAIRGIAFADDGRELGRHERSPTPQPPQAGDTRVVMNENGCPARPPLPAGDDPRPSAIDVVERDAAAHGTELEVLDAYPAQRPAPPEHGYAATPFGQCEDLVADRTWVVETRIPSSNRARASQGSSTLSLDSMTVGGCGEPTNPQRTRRRCARAEGKIRRPAH